MAEERTVWLGTPSQILNLGSFILLGLFFWLVIPLFVILWKWLVVKNTKYELTTERLRMRHGVFNKHTDELELYRVRVRRRNECGYSVGAFPAGPVRGTCVALVGAALGKD